MTRPKKGTEEKLSENRDFFQYMLPFLQRGCPVEMATRHANEVIRKHNENIPDKKKHVRGMSRSLVYERIQDDDEFSGRVEVGMETLGLLARETWREKIQKKDYMASRDYLRAKNKEEFSERIENHQSGGLEIAIDPELDKEAMDAIIRNT